MNELENELTPDILLKPYYGTKLVKAAPEMQSGVWGYAVVYDDGYRSWSPKDTFKAAYQPLGAMSFGHAIVAMKSGKRVARHGWNGKGMFLVLVPGSKQLTVEEGRPLAIAGVPVGTKFDYLPHIDMWTVDGAFVPWLASQTDMLANDWQVVG